MHKSIQINTNQYSKMVSNVAVNKSLKNGFTRDEHFEALANIEDLYQNAVLLERANDIKNNDSNVKIYRFASPFVVKIEDRYVIADALLTAKESIDKNSKKIYSLELTEIKKLSERGSVNHNSPHYTDSLNKLQQKHEKIKQFLEKNQENTHFSITPEDENLIVMHNVTAAKLRKAAKLGALPVPSLAIVDAERSDFVLNVKQQTETLQFKEWFKDSKVVDENDNSQVVYHGTTKYGFYVFRDDSFFTLDKNYADRYAETTANYRFAQSVVRCF